MKLNATSNSHNILQAEPESIPLDIVYEDAHVIVVNKVRGFDQQGLTRFLHLT